MNCRVISPSAEFSYRLKCVAVESERVFEDVVISPRTDSGGESRNKRCHKRRNLVEHYLQGPNFLELNRRRDVLVRRSSVSVVHREAARLAFKTSRSKSLDYPLVHQDSLSEEETTSLDSYGERRHKIYPTPPSLKSRPVALSSLVDQILGDIYGSCKTESGSGSSPLLQKARLQRRSTSELRVLLGSLQEHVGYTGGLLIRHLRRRDNLLVRREILYDVVTAHLQAQSDKSRDDTRMKFSLTPQPGESGFIQWLDAMKMVAKLQGGIPAEFRRKLWLTLAERHLEQRGIDWQQAEKICFNEWSNPDDEELGIQIVKDLHRTGCSLFCGAAGRDNQAVLRRVLLGFARWNKSVGYCQGLNVLGALILQVVDREEAAAVKVMIYLIEGVLPEAYFADSLRGLSIDMAVFRDLLRMRLPRLSKHLESLQNDTKDKATGSSYEPPLTNVFTMQWFLTLFCHCLPQDAVLRVWDLIFLEGDDVLLRTALAIWEGISDRIMTVTSADEFYSIMGVLTREMLEFTDTNHLIKTIVSMGPLNGITNLREKHRYNITPWARRLSDDEETDTEDDERLAVAAAAAIFSMPRLKKSDRSSSGALQAVAPASDRERLALDITTLKQQYAKLRERQRQAHIILSAACARQPIIPQPSSSPAMNHLLMGKNALVSGKNRLSRPLVTRAKAATMAKKQPQAQQPQQQGLTIHWKDMKKRKDEPAVGDSEPPPPPLPSAPAQSDQQPAAEITMTTATRKPASSGAQAADSDSDSTSTELCDEPDRLSDLDSEELEIKDSSSPEPNADKSSDHLQIYKEETSIAEITDQIRRLSADDAAEFKTSVEDSHVSQTEEVKPNLDNGYSTASEKTEESRKPENHYSESNRISISKLIEDNKALLNRDVSSPQTNESPKNEKSSYVIGHLPINYDSKKGRVLPEVFSPTKKDTDEDVVDSSVLSPDKKFGSYKIQLESKFSPKTPESVKSFDSGETMGPDSITSSLAATPLRSSDSRDFVHIEAKSSSSSVSSDSKTLTIRSVESEKAEKKELSVEDKSPPREKSVTPSTESLMRIKSPPCSSTESFCSPSKFKSSERSFSSDLQSPVSANSIKYTANYSYKSDFDLVQPISEITSPFYPISNPNQKTPSPYSDEKSKSMKDVAGVGEFRGIVHDQDTKFYAETKTPTQAFDVSQYKNSEENISIKVSLENDDETFSSGTLSKNYSYNLDDEKKTDDKTAEKDVGRTSAFEVYRKNKFDEELQETDTLSPLPGSHFENRLFERSRGQSLDGKLETLEISGKSYDRTSSSLEKRFPEMLLSPSMEDFDSVKKRSSDVLEDLRHLETKTTEDGEIDPKMLTRKTSFIWEDLRSLEARRQDTFTDSASTFSRQRVDVPGISISTEGRKTYVIEPKINIDDNSDSILKTVTYKNSNGTYDDEDDNDTNVEYKFGVWTKVKPRKRNDSGRRSSDRALKIIQENSAILQKILTCQARKRLPDLEEISKEITISPINEEISKIFSPILEKMGLNEHEINEELARISFKDMDRGTTTTTASEFEAKINEELSKLSLIGDNDEVAYLPDVDDISSDYLNARDAFIDRQMNEELSKILANYGKDSPMTQKSSPHLSENSSLCSTKIYSYQSSSESLHPISDIVLNEPLSSALFADEPLVPYVPSDDYIKSQSISAKSDVDIYRELEKLDQISYSKTLPTVKTEIVHPDVIPKSSPFLSGIVRSPKTEYPPVIEKQSSYDISPLKSPYNSPYASMTIQPTAYDYQSRSSPIKQISNPYSVRSYDPKIDMDTGFENSTFELTRKGIIPSALNYDYVTKNNVISKERLEFRVKYNPEEDPMSIQKSVPQDIDLKLSPFQTDVIELDKRVPYYPPEPVITPTHMYSSRKDEMDRSNYESTYQRRNYAETTSPAQKYSTYSKNYDPIGQPYKITTMDPGAEVPSYLNSSVISPNRHRDIKALSSQYQYTDYTKTIDTSYSTVSPINFDNSFSTTTNRSKNTYADIAPTDVLYQRSNLMLSNVVDGKQTVSSDTQYNLDPSPSPKSLGFSPFPVRNVPRKPKDVTVKLGLYSPTNTFQSKRS